MYALNKNIPLDESYDVIVCGGRNYKHVQITMHGTLTDFYYGGNDDGNNWDASALSSAINANYQQNHNPYILTF
mgnify:CR=1 FL=1